MFGGFFLGTEVHAAKLFAFLFEFFDTLVGLFLRR